MAAAVKLMQEKRTEHLVIVNPETQRAVGILTTFDIVQYMAGIAAGSFRRGVTELGELP
ncbi:MAG TPA: CBS domain-containing protein [Anaerolineae bacterium]|nr:CBS domain-containing protein [Anaerolineae bacterium]